MNYRHAFHAGNFADVMKHVILTRLIEYLKLKPAAFRMIDTHAGIGRYSLTGDEARRSPEWMDGIGKLLKAELAAKPKALIQPYLDVIAEENPNGTLARYPGSPLLARKLFREQDRLSALELHPRDVMKLSALFEGDIQARVTELDGWLALNAYVPPKEKRGLVLVDPSYEVKADYAAAATFVRRLLAKWPEATVLLWYPLLPEARHRDLLAALAPVPHLRDEVAFSARPARGMAGSGLALLNAPWGAANAFTAAHAQAAPVLIATRPRRP